MRHKLVKSLCNPLLGVRRRMIDNRSRDLPPVSPFVPIQALEILIPPVVQQFLDLGEIQELDLAGNAHLRINRLRDNRLGVSR